MAERRTWHDWDVEGIDGLYILDPDGFRNEPDDKLYTRDEFLQIRWRSTTGPVQSLPRMRADWFGRDRN